MEFSEDLIKRVSELNIYAKKNISSLLSGNYRSTFRGSGMQFKEFRHYEPGDDIRHMSWQVTARTGRATIKTYEEERELDVLLLVDVSGSSLFGQTEKRKIDMYAELVALIGLAAIKSRDNVGLLLFSDEPQIYLPPKSSRNQVLKAIASVLQQPLNGKKSDLRKPLNFANSVLKRRTIVILISDFMLPSFEEAFHSLGKRHETVLLHCYDDAEWGYLDSGVYEVWDPENHQFYLLDSDSTKNPLANYRVELRVKLEELCRRTQADYLCLSVEDDYLHRLVHFFKHRGPSRL